MGLTLAQTYTAISPGLTSSFGVSGGISPYTYSVVAGGAGGTVNASGIYTAPGPGIFGLDTIQVTDSTTPTALTASASILIGTAVELVCDILETVLGLSQGQVMLWDQKITLPTDSRLYIAVSVPSCKPFGQSAYLDPLGNWQQSVAMRATLDVNILSRSSSARDQKEQVVLALKSDYAEQQMEYNSFYLSGIPVGFTNLSEIDGAAIPYRYVISINLLYSASLATAVPYYGTFPTAPMVVSNP